MYTKWNKTNLTRMGVSWILWRNYCSNFISKQKIGLCADDNRGLKDMGTLWPPLAKESYQQLVVLSTMVFQFPKFVQLWGCAITHSSDFALLYFNMIVIHTAVVVWSSASPPKILLSTTHLLHEPEKSSYSLFSPPLCCTNLLMRGMLLQQMSHFKGLLSGIIRWTLVWATQSRGPTCLSGAISWLSHWFWEQCWSYPITIVTTIMLQLELVLYIYIKEERQPLHTYLNCIIFAWKFGSYVCFVQQNCNIINSTQLCFPRDWYICKSKRNSVKFQHPHLRGKCVWIYSEFQV